MQRSTILISGIMCSFFFSPTIEIWAHSEHGPYAGFEDPGFQWTESPPFSNGLGRIFLGKGYGFIDKMGKVVLQLYPQAEGFSEGLAAVSQNRVGGPWGYIDRGGALIIPYKFENVRDFSDGLAQVMVDGKWGYIDKSGKLVIPAQYDLTYPFLEGRASVRTPDTFAYSIIDKTGNTIVNGWGTTGFSEGLAYAWGPGGESALIDREGKKIALDRTYDWAKRFSEGVAAVGFKGQGGFIDKNGKLVLKLGPILADSFSEGLAPALKGKRWGYIDQQGKFAIKPQFEMAQEFSEGLAAVMIGGRWEYIDRTGKVILYSELRLPGKFSEGLAGVQIDASKDSYAYIDKTGKVIWKGTLF